MGDFRQLKAWQHARRLARECVIASRSLPPEERFGLADQLRRAANGAALNIAEGAARHSTREFLRYLDMARASLHEVEGILTLARDADYLDEVAHLRIEGIRAEAARTVYGLIRALRR